MSFPALWAARMNSTISSFSIVIAMIRSLPAMVGRGVDDSYQAIEEPDEVKVSCPVLETSGVGDCLAEFN